MIRKESKRLIIFVSLWTIVCGVFFAHTAMAEVHQLTHWKDLINLRPDEAALKAARRARNRSDAGLKVQRIEHARGPNVNFDEYSVTITRLPTSGPKSIDQLIQYIRINLNDFLDDEFATFEGFKNEDSSDWRSQRNAPIGSVMLFSIPFPPKWYLGYLIQEKAAVVVSEASKHTWTFSPVTIGILAPGEHPVSGNREFGLRQEGGAHPQIYTRGVDRAIGGRLDLNQQAIFRGAGALWGSFQRNVKSFIEKNGGAAQINRPIIRRPKWHSPEVAALLGKNIDALHIEEMLQDRIGQRKAIRQGVIQEEKKTWPQVLKKRAWAYLTSAVDLACANPNHFERKFRNQKLPGVHFTKTDFDHFYLKDRARKAKFFDFLKVRRHKPLSKCQKFVLDEMQKTARPVSIGWIAKRSKRYRSGSPDTVGKPKVSVNKVSKSVDNFISDIGERIRVKPSKSPPSSSSEYEPPNGINGDFGNLDLVRPDFDFGPGSTLGH